MAERNVRPGGRPVYGRTQPLTPPRRRRAPRLRLGQIPLRLVILAIAIVLVLVGLRQAFAVRNVTVQSSAKSADIKSTTEQLVRKSWLQQSLLTLNDGVLEDQLVSSDPMIKSVAVRRSWPHGLRVSVTLKQPALGWASGGQVYLIDTEGTAIGLMPANASYVVLYDGSNLPVTVGGRVVSGRLAQFMQALPQALLSAGINATRYEVKDTTLDLYVTTNKGYKLVLDTSRPLSDTISDLKATLASLAAQKRTPTQYIDLRVPAKAYYL